MEKYTQSFDICIICALYEEAEAVLNEFSTRCGVSFTKEFSGLDRYAYQYTTIRNKAGEPLTTLVTWLSDSGPTQTGLDLKPFLHEFRPRFVAMTGICAGDKRKVKLGDLVVAQYAYHYEEGKIIREPGGQLRQLLEMKSADPTSQVLQYARGFDGWKEPVREMKRYKLKRQLKATEEPRCVIAPMASGMAVRGDNPFPWLQEKYNRNTVALDMEAATFYRALRAVPHIHALVVKGVCDYADMSKNDAYHDYAARASAVYLLSFIQEYVTEQTMPQIASRAMGGSIALLTRSRRIQGAPTPISSGSTPITSVTPGTVVYQANLSKPDNIYKEWQGMIFSGNAGWKISNGALLSSGNSTEETIWVQSVLPTANYAIEAQMQVLTLPDGRSYSGPAIGLLLRGEFDGHLGYFAKISGNFVLDTAQFSVKGYGGNRDKSEARYLVDLKPHLYRAEVKGTDIKLIIDTVTIFEDRDSENLFPSSGQVGLMTSLVPVKVTSFKVIAL